MRAIQEDVARMAKPETIESVAQELRDKLIILEAHLALLGPDDADRAEYAAQIAEVRKVLASLDMLG